MIVNETSCTNLADIGEFGLIERLQKISWRPLPSGVVGIGDDCAVVPGALFGGSSATSGLMTTDTMVEGRHFRWNYTSAFDLGWKLLAVNLSDIAAMGGVPKFGVITLQLRSDLEAALVEDLYGGIEALAAEHDVHLVGGDTSQGTECAFGMTLFGVSDVPPVLRSGAKPGDDIWLSGTIGGAGAALTLLEKSSPVPDSIRRRYTKPIPRLALGQELAKRRLATSMIDVSDGLFQDLGHILSRSNVSADIALESIPLDAETGQVFAPLAAGIAGDDYELLFTAPPSARGDLVTLRDTQQIGLARIGMVTSDASHKHEISIRNTDGSVKPLAELLSQAGLGGRMGYQHFSG